MTPAPASYTFPPCVAAFHPNHPRPGAPRCRPPAVQPPLHGASFVTRAPRSPPLRSRRSWAQLCFSALPLRAEPGLPNTRNGRSGGRTFIINLPAAASVTMLAVWSLLLSVLSVGSSSASSECPCTDEELFVGDTCVAWGAFKDSAACAECTSHAHCPASLPFCYQGLCSGCSDCEQCTDGIDGEYTR